MNLLHAEYAKLIAQGGDLGAATERELIADENLTCKAEGVELDHIISTNPSPKEVIEIGTKIDGKFILAAGDRDDFVHILGGTHAADVYSKTQDIRILPQKDLRFRVATTAAGFVLIDLIYMFLTAMVEWTFKQNERFYLPVEYRGSNLSVLTIDGTNET